MERHSNLPMRSSARERISLGAHNPSDTGRRPALIPHSAVHSLSDDEAPVLNGFGHQAVPPPDDPLVRLSIFDATQREITSTRYRGPSPVRKRRPRTLSSTRNQYDINQQGMSPQMAFYAQGFKKNIGDQEKTLPKEPQLAIYGNKRKHRSPSEDAALQHPGEMAQNIPHMSEVESQDEMVAEAPPAMYDTQHFSSTLNPGRRRSRPKLQAPHSIPTSADNFPSSPMRRPSMSQRAVSPTDTSSC